MKNNLTPEQLGVMREGGTEVPFSGEYVHTKDKGMYKCAACGNALFSSDTKFDSGTGWPSFTDPVNLQNIKLSDDSSFGMKRTEVSCSKCGAHLGHVFDDLLRFVGKTGGQKDGRLPTGRQGKRYCINSVCLELEKLG